MGCCYMMQYMDKLALSQAAILDLRKDLVRLHTRSSTMLISRQGLHGSEYSWTSAVFYFGFLVWSWPSSYLIARLPLGKYVSVSVSVPPSHTARVSLIPSRFLWGGILMCHAAAKDFGGLMAARFFLGVGEAAIAPGFGLVTGMFYKREEQPSR